MSACSCFIKFIKQVKEKEINCEALLAFYHFFATSLINSIIHWSMNVNHSIYHMTIRLLKK